MTRLETTPQSYTLQRLLRVINYAAWFTEYWADWAERCGMQPVHLLRHSPQDEAGRGLAWRCGGMSVLCFPYRHRVIMEGRDNLFVYAFQPDGRTTHVFGDERADILGAQPELQQKPAVREAIIRG